MGFVFRLAPPRPGFAFDMSPDERTTMIEHVGCWSTPAEQGKALAFDPVDGGRSYGIGIIVADSRFEADALRDGYPALSSPHGFRTEIAPMLRLVTLAGTYDTTPG
jgi:hypothetical protein